MSCRDFRTATVLEWGAEPDLSGASEEALERTIWQREQAQALAGRVSAALGAGTWRPALVAAPAPELPGPWARAEPAVHVELVQGAAGRPAGRPGCCSAGACASSSGRPASGPMATGRPTRRASPAGPA